MEPEHMREVLPIKRSKLVPFDIEAGPESSEMIKSVDIEADSEEMTQPEFIGEKELRKLDLNSRLKRKPGHKISDDEFRKRKLRNKTAKVSRKRNRK